MLRRSEGPSVEVLGLGVHFRGGLGLGSLGVWCPPGSRNSSWAGGVGQAGQGDPAADERSGMTALVPHLQGFELQVGAVRLGQVLVTSR
jgi:hypothetical protein